MPRPLACMGRESFETLDRFGLGLRVGRGGRKFRVAVSGSGCAVDGTVRGAAMRRVGSGSRGAGRRCA